MYNSIKKSQIDSLQKNNWNISLRENSSLIDIQASIKHLTNEPSKIHIDFLSRFELFENPSEKFWFLMLEDYEGTSDSGFSWNEFQIQSLDAALDKSDIEKVNIFWETHFPIAMSVKSGYAYLAIKVHSTDAGVIVCGSEPEYEEAMIISPSLASLFEILTDHVTGKTNNPQLSQLL